MKYNNKTLSTIALLAAPSRFTVASPTGNKEDRENRKGCPDYYRKHSFCLAPIHRYHKGIPVIRYQIAYN